MDDDDTNQQNELVTKRLMSHEPFNADMVSS